ncbi:MAG: VOC family protein [Herpetosiphon sp.]
MLQQLFLHHVSVPRPFGSDAQVRAFYSAIVGLEEIPVPESLHDQGLIWYRIGASELHLFSEDVQIDVSARHFCIALPHLNDLRARLTSGGYEVIESIPIPGRPRFFCKDPFGNLIEFTTILQQ